MPLDPLNATFTVDSLSFVIVFIFLRFAFVLYETCHPRFLQKYSQVFPFYSSNAVK